MYLGSLHCCRALCINFHSGQEESMPSTQIAKCISTFLSCLDNEKQKNINSPIDDQMKDARLKNEDASKTSAGSTSLDNDCYNSFQDCSGSVILIPGLYNGTSTENQGIKLR